MQKFYNFYYTDIAKRLKLSLEEFFPPNRSKSVKGSSNKTLNLHYLAKLAKNPYILSSLITYIDSKFQENYLEELKTSLHQLVVKITNMIIVQYEDLEKTNKLSAKLFQKNEINSVKTLFSNSIGNQVEKELKSVNQHQGLNKASILFQKMKETILKQKMKIPWTVNEVQNGILFVRKKLKRIQKRNS